MMKYKEQPIKALKSFYFIIIEELNLNPMMKTILLKSEYPFIVNHMTEEQKLDERNKSLIPILELITYWKEKGLIKSEKDIDTVIGSLRSLVLLWFYKEEIGEDKYSTIIDFMIDRVCDYIN